MFTIRDNDWEMFVSKYLDDMGWELMEDLQKEIMTIKKHYDGAADDIKHWPEEHIVGSKEWAPAAINQGTLPGTWPNLDRLKEWIINTKDGGKNTNLSENEVDSIAWKVGQKIKSKGIDPTWYVDRVLTRWENSQNEMQVGWKDIVWAGDSPLPFADAITAKAFGEKIGHFETTSAPVSREGSGQSGRDYGKVSGSFGRKI